MVNRKRAISGVVFLVLLFGISNLINFVRKAEPVHSNSADWITGTLIAHRGVHNNAENIYENTIPAFAKAMEKGYIIELDVSLTKDNKMVVYHDKKLKRLFGIDSYLNEMNYKELARLKFPNSSVGIPLFDDVLELINGKVPLLIEIKNEGEVGKMEGMLYDKLKAYKGTYAIQSFNPYSVAWFRNNAPDVLRGQLSGSFKISDYEAEYAGTTRLPWYKRFMLSNLLLNLKSRPNFIAYEINNVSIAKLNNLKKLGVPLIGWTVENKEDYQKTTNIFNNFIVERFDIINGNGYSFG